MSSTGFKRKKQRQNTQNSFRLANFLLPVGVVKPFATQKCYSWLVKNQLNNVLCKYLCNFRWKPLKPTGA